MLILLPPSERKRPATRGRPMDVGSLSHPELAAARTQVLQALADVSHGPQAHAVLGVTPAAATEVASNTRWLTEPAQRVERLYTGVLFEALDLVSLPAPARRRAREWVRVVSAAHGLLRLDDAVPAYRLAIDATLPGVGPLAAHWRSHLAPVLDALVRGVPGSVGAGADAGADPGMGAKADGRAASTVVLDGRSSAYAATWAPARELADRVVALRVLSVQGPTRSVVSHAAKHTRGLVTRHLLMRGGRTPRTADALVSAVAEAFEVDDPGHRPGRVRRLDVLLRP